MILSVLVTLFSILIAAIIARVLYEFTDLSGKSISVVYLTAFFILHITITMSKDYFLYEEVTLEPEVYKLEEMDEQAYNTTLIAQIAKIDKEDITVITGDTPQFVIERSYQKQKLPELFYTIMMTKGKYSTKITITIPENTK